MRFTQAFLAALSAAAAQAVIITNADFSNIAVGTPFVITYSEASGPVTVYLGTGSPASVIQGAALGTSSGPTGSISWTPTSGGSYALKIVDAGAPLSPVNPNYSGFFNVAGPVVSPSSSTSVAPSSTSSVSSSLTSSMTTAPITTSSMTMNGTTTTVITSTSSMNGTTSSSSMYTPSSSSSQSSSTSVPTQVPNSMAAGIASPLAFVMVAVGALLTIN